MSQFSDYAENALFNLLLRATSLSAPTTVYIALYTSNPTDANTGTELATGNYVRQPVTFAAPSNGSGANSGNVTWDPASTAFGVISHIGIFDSLTGGNLLLYGALNSSKTIGAGDIFRISTGQLVVTLA